MTEEKKKEKVEGPLLRFVKNNCTGCRLKCGIGTEVFTNCLMAAILESLARLDGIYDELAVANESSARF